MVRCLLNKEDAMKLTSKFLFFAALLVIVPGPNRAFGQESQWTWKKSVVDAPTTPILTRHLLKLSNVSAYGTD